MLKRIYRLLEPADQKMCFLIAVSVFFCSVLNFAGLASVFPLLKRVIEGSGDTKGTMLLMAAVLLFIVLKNLAIVGLTRLQTNFLLRQFKHFSFQLFCRYYHKGLLFIRDNGAVKLTNDVNTLCLMFSVNVMQSVLIIAGEGLLVFLVLAALFYMLPLAAAYLVVSSLPLILFYVFVVKKKVRAYGKADLEARRNQARTVVETFRGYAELEISNAFSNQLNRFENGIDTINDSRKRLELIHAVPSLLSEVAVVLGISLLLVVQDGNQMLSGGIFALAAFRLMPAIRSMLNCWTTLQQSAYSVETLEKEMHESLTAENETDRLEFKEEFRLEDATFAYSEDQPVFDHFNCSIRKGECVGIQGASGAGKTTLFNVMLGFFPLQGGRIVIDGKPLTLSNRKAWHQIVGYVPQEIFILQASLADNVALGSPQVDRKRILEVLEQVQLKDFVDSLPDGIDTSLGEAGGRLSGGQKQRLGIARALYKKAEVLFFDEATSSLDNQTELEINKTLHKLSEEQKELTMVIIAHRQTSLSFCDRIISV